MKRRDAEIAKKSVVACLEGVVVDREGANLGRAGVAVSREAIEAGREAVKIGREGLEGGWEVIILKVVTNRVKNMAFEVRFRMSLGKWMPAEAGLIANPLADMAPVRIAARSRATAMARRLRRIGVAESAIASRSPNIVQSGTAANGLSM